MKKVHQLTPEQVEEGIVAIIRCGAGVLTVPVARLCAPGVEPGREGGADLGERWLLLARVGNHHRTYYLSLPKRLNRVDEH